MARDFYRPGARRLQDQFETRALADRITARLGRSALTDDDRAYIERMDMFFLATVDEEGYPNCSYKGGAPGFVKVVDDKTLAFPSYDGNGMFLSLGNIATTGRVGMLFIDFVGQLRLRVNGDATMDTNDPLMPSYPEADLVVRVKVREVFPNCPRYVHKMELVERSRFVPKGGAETPVPAWKQMEWAWDAVKESDPARDPKREVLRR